MTEALCTKIRKPLLLNSWTIILMTEFVNCERFNAGFIERSRFLSSGFMFLESKSSVINRLILKVKIKCQFYGMPGSNLGP